MAANDTLAKAYLFIGEATVALSNGTKHYSLDGKLLTTVADIAKALLRDGQIILEKPQAMVEN